MTKLQTGDDIIFNNAMLKEANLEDVPGVFGKSFSELVKEFETGELSIKHFSDVIDSIWPLMDKRYDKKAFREGGRFFGCRTSEFFVPEVAVKIEALMTCSNNYEQAIRKAKELATPIVVDGKPYRKIMTFSVMYSGWECDSSAWVVDADGENKIVMTNHGKPYFSTVAELEGLISGYQQTLNETQEAIEMVGYGTSPKL
jgi:hypothetical protein